MFKKTIRKRLVAVLAAVCMAMALIAPMSAQATVAGGSILYEPHSGRVLYEHRAHEKRPMASTTKLMTALVAAEALPLDRCVTVTQHMLGVEGTSMGLCVGDVLTVEDLLKGLLLASGNDAANVLALTVSDTLEAFAARMNERAKQIGMLESRFVTPSGLDADGHGSTPYDMALLAAKVLENEWLASVCAMRRATVSVSGRTLTLTNHNKLLASYNGAVGMKTGFTKAAGRCLVSAARRDGVTLVAVTLNCADDWKVHTDLLDHGFSLLKPMTLSPPSLSPMTVLGGAYRCVSLSTDARTVTVLRDSAHEVHTEVRMQPYVWAPIQKGETVGEVQYYMQGDCVATAPIYITQSMDACPPITGRRRFAIVFLKLYKVMLVG